MTFTEQFFAWIQEQGISTAAKQLGTYKSIVKRWVEGERKPTLDMLDKFYDIINPQKTRKDWNGKSLCIAAPFYKSTNPATNYCLMKWAMEYGSEKIAYNQAIGDSIIAHSRNRLAKAFLDSKAEWIFWIDDDMVPVIGKAAWYRKVCRVPDSVSDSILGLDALQRLMSHGKTIVSANYFQRNILGSPVNDVGMTNVQAYKDLKQMNDKLIPTKWAGTGSLLVHRTVFEDIRKKYGDSLKVQAFDQDYDYFGIREYSGEDVAFCARAIEAGHQVYVDCRCVSSHVGYYCYAPWSVNDISPKGGIW